MRWTRRANGPPFSALQISLSVCVSKKAWSCKLRDVLPSVPQLISRLIIQTSQHTDALRHGHHRIHLIARVLESRYHLNERNQQRPTLCSMLFGQ